MSKQIEKGQAIIDLRSSLSEVDTREFPENVTNEKKKKKKKTVGFPYFC